MTAPTSAQQPKVSFWYLFDDHLKPRCLYSIEDWAGYGRKELLTDVFIGNLRQVLAMTDRNAMAHSIKARVSYVDRRIIEFAWAAGPLQDRGRKAQANPAPADGALSAEGDRGAGQSYRLWRANRRMADHRLSRRTSRQRHFQVFEPRRSV
jgi:hypothetical protein